MAGSRTTTGQIEVTFGYRRHVGGRFVHGCVTLQFDSLRPYSFDSQAQWPPSGDNYEPAIREAVEDTLQKCQGTPANAPSAAHPHRLGRSRFG